VLKTIFSWNVTDWAAVSATMVNTLNTTKPTMSTAPVWDDLGEDFVALEKAFIICILVIRVFDF
jgi:hypothetical protein